MPVSVSPTCSQPRPRRDEITAYRRKRYADAWAELLVAYGSRCACCGETRERFLTIDHVFNDGGAEKRREGYGSGIGFYLFLKRRGYPKDRYRLLCYNCNCGRARNGGVCPHEEERRCGV